jgi:hypothetical protein
MNACIAILLWPKQSSVSRGVVERSTTKGFVSIPERICRFAFPCRSGQPSRRSQAGSPASEMQTKPECAVSGHCSDERELPSKQRSALGHAPHSPALRKRVTYANCPRQFIHMIAIRAEAYSATFILTIASVGHYALPVHHRLRVSPPPPLKS